MGLEEGIWREGVDDVGERVRSGVEEVFEGVSLKNKIGILELHRLISDVRRRVEHESHSRERNERSTFFPHSPHLLLQRYHIFSLAVASHLHTMIPTNLRS